jgi:uncharacterized protein YyaL (SSP411 family)
MAHPPLPNHLKDTHSPYLHQHAENPVAWYPWGEQALSRAHAENKPIFLSIGYSSCHWCHVMAHESFEDTDVAAILNRSFISIKVDREERPDIDATYMTFAQVLTGAGGWPLTIVMTPDKEPFFAATYIPKTGRFGRKGLIDILEEIETLWQNNNVGLRDSAGKIRAAIEKQAAHPPEGTFSGEAVHVAFMELSNTFDEEYGGFGIAPKFPSPHIIIFLLKYWAFSGNTEARRMAEKTLDGMIMGSLGDHVAGGFHRYSVTRDWRIPHFEKMLYDQAMMLYAYTEGWRVTGKEVYKRVAEDTAAYLFTSMRSDDGGFFSAEDADSDGKEGSTYLWTSDELRDAAGEYADEVFSVFDIREQGNSSGNMHDFPPGKQTLAFASLDAATRWYTSENLTDIRNNLLQVRNRRPLPFRDDKILTDWNGLCIGALAYAGRTLGHPEYIRAGELAAEALPYTKTGLSKELLHSRFKGVSSGAALLDDYASVLWGYLMLYEATFDAAWLERVQHLTRVVSEQFPHPHGGYYLTAANVETPLMRQQTAYDGALPSGNSLLAVSLVIFARITAEPAYEADAVRILDVFAPEIHRAPSAHCHLLSAYMHMVSGEECVIVPGQEGTTPILQLLTRGYQPFRSITIADGSAALITIAPFTQALKQKINSTTLYVCREGTCSVPLTDLNDIEDYVQRDPLSLYRGAPEH